MARRRRRRLSLWSCRIIKEMSLLDQWGKRVRIGLISWRWETICVARGRGTCTWLTVRGIGSRLLDSLPREEKIFFLLIGLVGHHSTKTESLVGSLHRWEVTKRGKLYLLLEGTATIGFKTRMPFDPIRLLLKERTHGITECHTSII